MGTRCQLGVVFCLLGWWSRTSTTKGSCFGLLETFLFWLLQDLGAKKYLMGITVTVGSAAGIPFLLASTFIFKKMGLANTIVLGLVFYAIRFMGYSFITNPWLCMPFEVLECFTSSLMTTAYVTYAAELSTPSTMATLQSIVSGLHYGVGRGVGSLLSGLLIGPLGLRNVFRLFALICCVTAILYFIISRLFFKKLQKEKHLSNVHYMPTEEEHAVSSISDGKESLPKESYEEDVML